MSPAEALQSAVAPLCEDIMFVTADKNDAVHIELISVLAACRGQGRARRLLAAVAAWADEQQTRLSLVVSEAFGSEIPRLVSLYSGYGFTWQRAAPGSRVRTNITMVRHPQRASA